LFIGFKEIWKYWSVSRRKIPMRIAIQADDGDEVSISADFLSVEQAIVTLEIENILYSEVELDSVTLTIDKARELARALVSVADAIESVRRSPADSLVHRPTEMTAAHCAY
jgi:hypothetical protein